MTYKDALVMCMKDLASIDNVRFIGYNVAYGPRMNGTLNDVPLDKCIEMPVAENLIVGVAMGLSLEGFFPIICFERMDFMLVAADAIINHLDKLPKLSGGQFDFPLLIRCCVGDDKPLDPGIQHTSDYTNVFKHNTTISIHPIESVSEVFGYYKNIHHSTTPTMLVEYKRLYAQESTVTSTARVNRV
jgi:pyruvate/2-oxoglutarate/acetoin dehydrogenase E1 component